MTKSVPLRPPSYLSRDAASVWRRVVVRMRDNGTLLAADVGVIESYCMAVVRQRQLTAELDKAGLRDADGKPNPFLRTIEATCASVKNLGCALGLSPLARKALPAKPGAKANGGRKDVWAGVLDK